MVRERIYIAGHRGMVGSAIARGLQKFTSVEIITRSRAELDLTNQAAVNAFFAETKIDQVYLAAAKVGGIHANNTYPADFLYENLMIEANIIHSAFSEGVKKICFLGSSCIYPRDAKQPMREEALMTGPLEPTNEAYAIAKIAGIKLCESYRSQYGASHSLDYRSLMPTNLYGPGDDFESKNSHVVPALISRFHNAKVNGLKDVVIWGSGLAKREFLHVDDLARAATFLMGLDSERYWAALPQGCSHLNVGSGEEVTILQLAELIREVIGYEGGIKFDQTMPDGAPRKLLVTERLSRLGFKSQIGLREGLEDVYKAFLAA